MAKEIKLKEKVNEFYILAGILIFVIVFGILGLSLLQRLSVNNKYICNYLGGLWVKKDTDQVHRCYIYEEYYD